MLVRPKFIVFVLVILTLFFGAAFMMQNAQVRKLNAEIADIQDLVLEAYSEVEELERRLAFTATDEYVEQEARRRFGYLNEGEIRFVLED